MSGKPYDTCAKCGAYVPFPRRKLENNREYRHARFTPCGNHFILCEDCYRRVVEFILGR